MCRIAFYASAEDEGKIRHLFKSFSLGALYDFVLDDRRRGYRVHGHGWGYAYIYGFLNDMGYSFYKTSLPMLSEGITLSIPKHYDWLLLIMHSRLTSTEPIDVVNAHPYYFSRVGGISMWLAHNGFIDKVKLAKDLGLENLVNNYSDSYILTQWLGTNIKNIDNEELITAVNRIVDLGVVISALNIVALILSEVEKKVLGVIVNYVAEKSMNLYDYYALYKVDMGARTLAITSSTVALYLNRLYRYNVEKIDNGVLMIVRSSKDGVEVETVNIMK